MPDWRTDSCAIDQVEIVFQLLAAGVSREPRAALESLRGRIALSEPDSPILAALADFQAELPTDPDLPVDHPDAIRLRLRPSACSAARSGGGQEAGPALVHNHGIAISFQSVK